jgi:DNA repair photolyase
MEVREITCKSVLSESRLYDVDYSINPYTGCQHGCRYCYAVYMKKYTDREEPWGEFVDVKVNVPEKLKEDLIKAEPGSVLLSSVTDPYQPAEKKYGITREILEILSETNFPVSILTKNDMVLRDMDVIKEFSPGKISIGFTVNFMDEEDRRIWEPAASPIQDRVDALEKLSSENIPTYAHVGPYLEGITDLEKILERIEKYIFEFQIENLNTNRRREIMKCISENYPELEERYRQILKDGSRYLRNLRNEVDSIKRKYDLPVNLFID